MRDRVRQKGERHTWIHILYMVKRFFFSMYVELQIHQLNYNDETRRIDRRIFAHPRGEIWYVLNQVEKLFTVVEKEYIRLIGISGSWKAFGSFAKDPGSSAFMLQYW